MKLQAVLYKAGYTQDGYLSPDQGRIVIYNERILFSHGNHPDHITLLQSLAAKYHFNKDDVISGAIRLYYKLEGNTIIISQNRRIDEDMLLSNTQSYAKLIQEQFR